MPWLLKNAEAIVLILLMGLLSGLAQFIINVKAGRERMSLASLIGECVISGSASLIAGMFLLEHAPLPLVIAMAGVAGHMGTRFLFLAERALTDAIKARVAKREGGQ